MSVTMLIAATAMYVALKLLQPLGNEGAHAWDIFGLHSKVC
jgi:hypothetical protein